MTAPDDALRALGTGAAGMSHGGLAVSTVRAVDIWEWEG
jgi:hypothetical protein